MNLLVWFFFNSGCYILSSPAILIVRLPWSMPTISLTSSVYAVAVPLVLAEVSADAPLSVFELFAEHP